MNRTDLRTVLYARIDELPSLPAAVPRILALLEDPDAAVGDLTEAIGHDPALTRAAETGEDLHRVERELIGADHGEAGGGTVAASRGTSGSQQEKTFT